MPAMELLSEMMGLNVNKISRFEKLFIEAEIFMRLCEELKNLMKLEYHGYFRLIKLNAETENNMIEDEFVSCIIKDILETEEYSLAGIAYYTHVSEEVIYDIAIGTHNNPSFMLSRKLIQLHRSVKPDLYRDIAKKIALDCIETPGQDHVTQTP